MIQVFKTRQMDLNPLEVAKESKCSYCCRLMRQEVYSCTNGHRGCEFCISKMESCPVCQISFVQQSSGKTEIHVFRDLAFEQILNSLKFPCFWKDKGCTFTPLYRWSVGIHQAQCSFNKESFKVCDLFSDFNQELSGCCPIWCPIESADPRLRREIIDHMLRKHCVRSVLINIGEQAEFILKPREASYHRSFNMEICPKLRLPWRKNQVVYLADMTIQVPVVHSEKCTVIYAYILVSRHIFHTSQESFLSWTLVEITPESELLPRSYIHLGTCHKPNFFLSYHDKTPSNNLNEFVVSIRNDLSGNSPNSNIPKIGLVEFRKIVTPSVSKKPSAAYEKYFSTGIKIKRDFQLDMMSNRETWNFERIQKDSTKKYSNTFIPENICIQGIQAVRTKFTDIIAKQRPCACNTSLFSGQ